MDAPIVPTMAPLSIAAVAPRPPRAVAWLLLLGSAAAVLMTGLVATVVILSQSAGTAAALGYGLWVGLVAVSALTAACLGLRALRWIYLLRRSETRIPIRDAYIGYLAGFSLLLAPLLLGEIVVRSQILKSRGGVDPATTAVVNVWERLLDLVAVSCLVGAFAAWTGSIALAVWLVAPAVILSASTVLRRAVLRVMASALGRVWTTRPEDRLDRWHRLASPRTWHTSLAASLLVWLLSSGSLWLLLAATGPSLDVGQSSAVYLRAVWDAAVRLAPGGVVVTGGRLVDGLSALGVEASVAGVLTLGVRLATTGLATAVGVVFVFAHRRSRRASGGHFDTIAGSYDVQIPEARRHALLDRKTRMMQEVLRAADVGPKGLDVGCGQGWYVRRMRDLGFDVTGVDSSSGQVALAGRHLGDARLARSGSALAIPEADESLDFVYTINVLHHLPSVSDQRRAFHEILRVVRPGGVVFVHEINTRNPLFRFYMGYVFPSLNCIDEGVERWILPDRLEAYTNARIVETRYFTFLPEFTPAAVVRLLAPIERLLERSPLGVYSAHYMAVLRKDA